MITIGGWKSLRGRFCWRVAGAFVVFFGAFGLSLMVIRVNNGIKRTMATPEQYTATVSVTNVGMEGGVVEVKKLRRRSSRG